jgi:hypothetical protein
VVIPTNPPAKQTVLLQHHIPSRGLHFRLTVQQLPQIHKKYTIKYIERIRTAGPVDIIIFHYFIEIQPKIDDKYCNFDSFFGFGSPPKIDDKISDLISFFGSCPTKN